MGRLNCLACVSPFNPLSGVLAITLNDADVEGLVDDGHLDLDRIFGNRDRRTKWEEVRELQAIQEEPEDVTFSDGHTAHFPGGPATLVVQKATRYGITVYRIAWRDGGDHSPVYLTEAEALENSKELMS